MRVMEGEWAEARRAAGEAVGESRVGVHTGIPFATQKSLALHGHITQQQLKASKNLVKNRLMYSRRETMLLIRTWVPIELTLLGSPIPFSPLRISFRSQTCSQFLSAENTRYH